MIPAVLNQIMLGVAGASGGGSTPPPVSNLILLWDSSVFASLTLSGSTVTAIADQSGHGNNAGTNPGFVSHQPSYDATGFNSKPTFTIAPTLPQTLACTGFPIGTGSTLTCWCVGSFPSDSLAYARAISYEAAGASADFDNLGSFFLGRDNNTTSVVIGRNNNFRTSAIAAGYDTPRRIIATIKSDGTQTVYVDGTGGGTTYTGAAFVSGGVIAMGNTGYGGFTGQGSWGGATSGTGKISEIGISTDWIDATAVATLDLFLQTKWGL